MRFKCKHKKYKGEDRRGKIPDAVSIHERPTARRTAPASDIGKAILSSEKEEQTPLPHTLSVKAVISLPLKLPTGRTKPLRLQLLLRLRKFPKN